MIVCLQQNFVYQGSRGKFTGIYKNFMDIQNDCAELLENIRNTITFAE